MHRTTQREVPARQRRAARKRGSTELTALFCLVALVGLAGLKGLGRAMGVAIAGDAAETATAAPSAGSSPPPTRVGSALPRGPIAAVVHGVAASVFARAAEGLYRAVPTRLPTTPVMLNLRAPGLFGLLERSEVPAAELAARVQRAHPEVHPASVAFTRDLFVELQRLRAAGIVPGAVKWGTSGNDSPAHKLALAILFLHETDHISLVRGYREAGRKAIADAGLPVPEAFLTRLEVAEQIFGRGADPSHIGEAFRRRSWDTTAADAARLLEPYEGANPLAFEDAYLLNPESALALLPDRSRRYLETELLPILRSSRVDESGASEPRFSRAVQAEILGRVLAGDPDGARGAAPAPVSVTDFAQIEEQAEIADAIEFAAMMFRPAEDAFRRFTDEEAKDLIRLDGNLENLRARDLGGRPLADAAAALRDADFPLRPGRAPEHRSRVLELLLQSVARGATGELPAAIDALGSILAEFPASAIDDLRALAARFAEAQ